MHPSLPIMPRQTILQNVSFAKRWMVQHVYIVTPERCNIHHSRLKNRKQGIEERDDLQKIQSHLQVLILAGALEASEPVMARD